MGCSVGSIQILRGSYEDFYEKNKIIDAGELSYAIDRGILKIGNGIDEWRDLPYIEASGCVEPCTKIFRLYSKINFLNNGLDPYSSPEFGLPTFDTHLDIKSNEDISIEFSEFITSGADTLYPDTLQENGIKTTLALINGSVIASGSSFRGIIPEGGRLFVGVNDTDYSDNTGYFLVKVQNFGQNLCVTGSDNPPATTTLDPNLYPTTTTSTTSTTIAPPVPCADIIPIDVFDTISLGVTYGVSDYAIRKLHMFEKIAMNQSGSAILFRSRSLQYNAQPPTWIDYCDAQSLSIVESGVPRSLKGPDGEPLHDQPPDPNAIYGNNRDGIERIDIYQNCEYQYKYPLSLSGDYIEDLQMFHVNGYDIITFTENVDSGSISNGWVKRYRWRRNGAKPDPTSSFCDTDWNCGNTILTRSNYTLYPNTNHVLSRDGKVAFITIWNEDVDNSYNEEPEIIISKLKEDLEYTVRYSRVKMISNIIFATKDASRNSRGVYDNPIAPMATNEDGTILLTTTNFSESNKSLDIVVYSGEYTPSTLGYEEEIDFVQLGNTITVPDEALKWTRPIGFGGSVPGAQSSIQAVINGIGNVLCVFRDDWKVKSTILEIYKYKEDLSDWEKVFSHTKELSSIREIRINNEGNIVAVATNTSFNEVEVYFSDNSKENWRKVFSKTGVMESQGFASSIAMNDDGSLLSISSDPYIRGECFDGCDWPLASGSTMEVYNLMDIDC